MSRKILFSILLSLFSLAVFSQNDNTMPKPTKAKSKWDKMFGEVKFGDKVYKEGSNWFTVGAGASYKLNYDPELESTGLNRSLSLAYHHRFRAMYFNAGWHYSGEYFFFEWKKRHRAMHQLNDFHIGAGLRFEKRWYHFGFFIGPCWAIAWVPNPEIPTSSIIKNTIGGHVEVQTTFKFFYDMGIGLSFFGSFNKYYQVVGVQGHFYFSGAYKQTY
ncbi:MAG: hypothetical protein HUK15_00645 [Bacteroidales bacterium]|nr:hypothetical protein [Bacteroidales bacterium]